MDGIVNTVKIYADEHGNRPELRIHYGPGYRVYYGKEGNQIYLLL